MAGAWANAATQCSTSVLPPRMSSCLGRAAPNRVPTPPPSTTATNRVTVVTSGTLPPRVPCGYPRQLVDERVRWGNVMPARGETMRMTAERVTANRRPVGPVVRLAIACRMPPVAMARISLGFAVIAAVWLSLGSARDDGVALAAAIAVFVAVDAGRVLGQESAAPVVEWGLTASALL